MYEFQIFSSAWLITAIGVFGAAYIQGALAFAFALILTPILLLHFGPEQVVITNLSLSVVHNSFNVIVRKNSFFLNLNLKVILPIIVFCIPGMLIGVNILNAIDIDLFKVIIGLIIFLFTILLSISNKIMIPSNKVIACIVGLFSGTMMTSTSLGGPPVVLYMHSQNLNKERIYSNQILYWLFLAFFSLITLFIFDIGQFIMLLQATAFIPFLLTGLYLGICTFNYINLKFFKFFTIIIISIASLYTVVSGLTEIL